MQRGRPDMRCVGDRGTGLEQQLSDLCVSDGRRHNQRRRRETERIGDRVRIALGAEERSDERRVAVLDRGDELRRILAGVDDD